MKKMINLGVTLLATICLAGCSLGGFGTTDVDNDNKGIASLVDDEDDLKQTETEEEPDEEIEEEPDEEIEEEPEEEIEEEPEEAATGAAVVRGTKEDGDYVNEFFGIKIEAPEGSRVFTDEEIAALTNITIDMTDNDKAQDYLDNGQLLMEYYYSLGDGSQTVNVGIQENVFAAFLNEETLAETMAGDGTYANTYDALGFDSVTSVANEVTIDGETFQGVIIEGSSSSLNIGIACQQIIIIKDKYLMYVTFTSIGDKDSLQNLLDSMSVID